MAYWAACRLQPHRTALALHVLGLRGFETYCPRPRERRARHGRRVEAMPPLFPGYAFVLVTLQWTPAHYAPGVLGLGCNGGGGGPARVPDHIISELRARERGGLIELSKPRGLQAGDAVRVLHGPFAGRLALYAGQAPHERVAVLLALLGGAQRVTLPKTDVEAVLS